MNTPATHQDDADDLSPLLTEPFAKAWAAPATSAAPVASRGALLGRLSSSRLREAGMTTTRLRRAPRLPLAEGVVERLLYATDPKRPLRAGEPLRARLIELAPGSRLDQLGMLAGADAEWLVVQGEVQIGGHRLGHCDYLVHRAGDALGLSSHGGGQVFVRESPAEASTTTHTVLDAVAGWPEFGPGIRRRVLWQRGTQAAMLYKVEAGAFVPDHVHGHDEECLMVAGELFLDDLLMQPLDYQVAPVGTHHQMTQAETDGILYGHGDLDLQFV